MAPRISIVIPTYNRADVLEQTLRGYLQHQKSAPEFELLVVDDGSTDASPRILESLSREFAPRLSVITQQNRGPAAARNRALEKARGEIVYFTGDDIIPSPHLLAEHSKMHTTLAANTVAVLGKIVWSPSHVVTPFMRWLESSGMQFNYGNVADPLHVPPEMFYTSNISLKYDFLARQNPCFDETIRTASWEDVDLGIRLTQQGLQIVYCDGVIAYHQHHTTLRTYARRVRAAGFSHAYVIAKHHLPEKPKTLVTELMKLVLGALGIILPIAKVKHYCYRWILSWHEFLGMQRFRRESKRLA